jgi:hypothetical protein
MSDIASTELVVDEGVSIASVESSSGTDLDGGTAVSSEGTTENELDGGTAVSSAETDYAY